MAFTGNFVPDVVSALDVDKIPHEIVKKLEGYVKDMCETNCALRDTWRTKEESYENRMSNYEQESGKLLLEIVAEKEKQRAFQIAMKEMEKQIEVMNAKLLDEQECRRRMEAENAELSRMKDTAVQENTALQNTLKFYRVNIRQLEEKCKTTTLELQQAMNDKYEVLTKCQEERNAMEAMQTRHSKVELQLELLRRHYQELAGSLNKYKADFSGARHDFIDKLVGFETQLLAKTDECAKQTKIIDSLRSSLQNAEDTVRKLGNKLNEQQQSEIRVKEGFDKELKAVNELAEIYKNMYNDGETTVQEALSKVKEMNLELEETITVCLLTQERQAKSESEFRNTLSEKDKCITAKEKEIKATYDLISATIKEEVTEAVNNLSAESDLRRQFEDCGSIVNFIHHCASLAEKLRTLKQENKYHILYLQKLQEEIEDRAPVIKKQRDDYNSAMNMVVQQSQQLEALNEELKNCQESETTLKEQLSSQEQENYSLRSQLADLGQQVCHLLREVELARAGDSALKEVSENMVVFGSIEELQAKNLRLLELYAELSKEKECEEEGEDTVELKERVSQYEAQLKRMQEEVENCKAMARSIAEEKNMFRKLHQRLIYGRCGVYESDSDVDVEPKPSAFTVEELTEKLTNMAQELKDLQMSSDSFDKDRQASDRAMMEEREKLTEELVKANDEVAKLYGDLQVCHQKLKSQEEAVNAGRQKVALLEGQNIVYTNRAAEDKHTIKLLKEKAEKWEQQSVRQEELVEVLRREVEEAKAAARGSGLQVGVAGAMHRQEQRLAQLLECLDGARTRLEDWEEQQGTSSQEQLNNVYQECLSLSRNLQESRKNFEEERKKLLSDIDVGFKKVVEERKLRSKLETELIAAKKEIEKKSVEIVELNKMLLEKRLTRRTFSHPAHLQTSIPEAESWRKRVGDVEMRLAQKQGEVELLQQRLGEARSRADTFSDMCEKFEQQWKEAVDGRRDAEQRSQQQLSEARHVEQQLRGEVQELEDSIKKLSADFTEPAVELQHELEAAQLELSKLLRERDSLREELLSAQQTVTTLRESLSDMEKNYRHEEVVHVSDSKEVDRLKKELNAVSGRLAALTADQRSAEALLEGQREQSAQEQREMQSQLSQLQEQLLELEAQNSLLHDQLEAIGHQATTRGSQSNISGSLSANSSINSSFIVEEDQAPEQLMKIIRFLRKEKNQISKKLSAVRSENAFITVQLEELRKQLEESKHDLVAAQKKAEAGVPAVALDQEERVKKAEILFAMKNNNCMLRHVEEELSAQLKDVTTKYEEAVSELESLRVTNKELLLQADQLGMESRAACEEAARMRLQYAHLVERTTRANNEERQRIQKEREALLQQLAAETSAHQLLQQQVTALHEEKVELVQQIETLEQQHAESVRELRELIDLAESQNVDLMKKIDESEKELEENAVIMNDLRVKLSAKEAELQDIFNKEVEIKEEIKVEKRDELQTPAVMVDITDSLSSQEIPEDTEEQHSTKSRLETEGIDDTLAPTVVEEPADQSERSSAPELKEEQPPTRAEADSASVSLQSASQSVATVGTASQQPEQVLGDADMLTSSDTELTPATDANTTSCQVLVSQPASFTVDTSVEANVKVLEETAVVAHSDHTVISQSSEESAVTMTSSQPGIKRGRETESSGLSSDEDDDRLLQAKRIRTFDVSQEEAESEEQLGSTEGDDVLHIDEEIIEVDSPDEKSNPEQLTVEVEASEGVSDEVSKSMGQWANLGGGDADGAVKEMRTSSPVPADTGCQENVPQVEGVQEIMEIDESVDQTMSVSHPSSEPQDVDTSHSAADVADVEVLPQSQSNTDGNIPTPASPQNSNEENKHDVRVDKEADVVIAEEGKQVSSHDATGGGDVEAASQVIVAGSCAGQASSEPKKDLPMPQVTAGVPVGPVRRSIPTLVRCRSLPVQIVLSRRKVNNASSTEGGQISQSASSNGEPSISDAESSENTAEVASRTIEDGSSNSQEAGVGSSVSGGVVTSNPVPRLQYSRPLIRYRGAPLRIVWHRPRASGSHSSSQPTESVPGDIPDSQPDCEEPQ